MAFSRGRKILQMALAKPYDEVSDCCSENISDKNSDSDILNYSEPDECLDDISESESDSEQKLPELYGKMYEKVAKLMLGEQLGLEVVNSGLYIDLQYPFLAASPDRLLGTNEIVEVKCLYRVNKLGITLEEAVKTIPSLCLEIKNNKLSLKRSHNYYYQRARTAPLKLPTLDGSAAPTQDASVLPRTRPLPRWSGAGLDPRPSADITDREARLSSYRFATSLQTIFQYNPFDEDNISVKWLCSFAIRKRKAEALRRKPSLY
ncbi:hypothetical protein FQR65_LT16271 [Abscondita terminalis]|nr:hypothetical protein FQR65_LT16271 [Abscondita terminalis]